MQSTLKQTRKGEDKGAWYGLVFGVDEDRDQPLHEVEEYITYKDNGRLKCGSSENAKVQEFFGKIVNQLDKFWEICITYHNGYTDRVCGFHGYHWHVWLHARLHPTSDARWGKDLQALGRASPAGERMYLAAMVARSTALLKHILKPPRELKWQQGPETTENVTKLMAELEEDKNEDHINWDPAKLSQNRNVERIKVLTCLMEKYATIANNQLRRRMLADDDSDDPNSDWNQYVMILAAPNFEQLFKKAVTIMKSTYLNKDIDKLFEIALDTRDPKYIPLAESMKVVSRWCEHQGIDECKFVTELFHVLKRKIPKMNTFAIQGPPNAGKSFILRSLLPWYRWWGEIRLDSQGYAFAFENAVDVGIIFIDEPVIGPVQVEQMKLLMEGMGTYVKCKRIGDEFVERTPLLITHNDCLSRFVSSIDGEAMKTRMYHYETKKTDWLKDYTKLLNPGIWPLMWKMHGLDIEEMMTDDTNIPTAEEQAALEEEARSTEFQRTEISTEEIQEIYPPKIAKLIQTDGPFDDSDEDDDTNTSYKMKVEELMDGINDFIRYTAMKVDTQETENNTIQEDIIRRLDVDNDWYVSPALRTEQQSLIEANTAYWVGKSNIALTEKWRFIEDISKMSSSIDRNQIISRMNTTVAEHYPIIGALQAAQNMLYYMEHKIKRLAAVEAASQLADECVIGLNVPPNAPKIKRSRRVNSSAKKACVKKLKLDM